MAVPILMVILSMTLPARANRRANLVVASCYVLVSAVNVIGETWTYFFGLAVGLDVLVLAVILRAAWTWPRSPPQSSTSGPDREVAHLQQAWAWPRQAGCGQAAKNARSASASGPGASIGAKCPVPGTATMRTLPA
jgi:hypothetical protein